MRPVVSETTALGAAYAAGLAVGYWRSLEDLRVNLGLDRQWDPIPTASQREELFGQWKKAVSRTVDWVTALDSKARPPPDLFAILDAAGVDPSQVDLINAGFDARVPFRLLRKTVPALHRSARGLNLLAISPKRGCLDSHLPKRPNSD